MSARRRKQGAKRTPSARRADAQGRRARRQAAKGEAPAPRRSGTPGRGRRPAAPQRPAAVVLLRCPTPTDYLCPCGAVSRKLRKLGIEHRVERVPYRRRARPEVVELTDQERVPVLIDGREVISDSKRIREYLQWRYGDRAEAAEAGEEESGAGATA